MNAFQKLHSGWLDSLRGVFKFCTEQAPNDDAAAKLVPVILSEAAYAADWRPHDAGHAGFRDEEAFEAARLLSSMPAVKRAPCGSRHKWENEFSATRLALWDAILRGVHMGDASNQVRHVKALLKLGLFTDEGSDAFKLLTAKRPFDAYGAEKLLRALHELGDKPYSHHVMCCLLHGLINGIGVTMLEKVMKAISETKI